MHRFILPGEARVLIGTMLLASTGRTHENLKQDEDWISELLGLSALILARLVMITNPKDFPGGPVVKTPCIHFRGCEFHSWSGN